MASKDLEIFGLDGSHLQRISVTDETTIKEILMQFHEEGKGRVTLIRGEENLQVDSTVRDVGLEDGEELYLVWSKKYLYCETGRLATWQLLSLDEYKDHTGGIYVQVPEEIEKIETCAFEENANLVEILIHDRVKSIGANAFRGCKRLKQMVIPDSVTSIGNQAFQDCSSLTQVVIPQSVDSIGNHLFHGCSSLSEVVIPDSVKTIPAAVFRGCKSLTQVAWFWELQVIFLKALACLGLS